MLVNSGELRAADLPLAEVRPLHLDTVARGDRRTRGAAVRNFHNNLKFFGVPEASIFSIYSKLAMRTFDVYANILKCMYSTRFNGGETGSEASADAQLTPCVDTTLTHPIRTLPQSDKYKRRKKESPKERDK
jgi:hypothetical protein